jgi:pyridoxine 5'-phosphate synthase PdxJ
VSIGHFIICEAIFSGLDHVIRTMRTIIDETRGNQKEMQL